MAESQDMKISNEKQNTQVTRIISRITMFFVKHTVLKIIIHNYKRKHKLPLYSS